MRQRVPVLLKKTLKEKVTPKRVFFSVVINKKFSSACFPEKLVFKEAQNSTPTGAFLKQILSGQAGPDR